MYIGFTKPSQVRFASEFVKNWYSMIGFKTSTSHYTSNYTLINSKWSGGNIMETVDGFAILVSKIMNLNDARNFQTQLRPQHRLQPCIRWQQCVANHPLCVPLLILLLPGPVPGGPATPPLLPDRPVPCADMKQWRPTLLLSFFFNFYWLIYLI